MGLPITPWLRAVPLGILGGCTKPELALGSPGACVWSGSRRAREVFAVHAAGLEGSGFCGAPGALCWALCPVWEVCSQAAAAEDSRPPACLFLLDDAVAVSVGRSWVLCPPSALWWE